MDFDLTYFVFSRQISPSPQASDHSKGELLSQAYNKWHLASFGTQTLTILSRKPYIKGYSDTNEIAECATPYIPHVVAVHLS